MFLTCQLGSGDVEPLRAGGEDAGGGDGLDACLGLGVEVWLCLGRDRERKEFFGIKSTKGRGRRNEGS
jgi:hypothetical protein